MAHPARLASPDERLAALRGVLGERGMVTEPAAMAGHLGDWAGDERGSALAVLKPATVEEVQACTRLCAESRLAVIPQGGNTGLVSASFADDLPASVIVSLSRLNRIRAVDAGNFTLQADAGCTLQQVKDAAEAADCMFPLALGAQGSCQLGGNAATNAGGVNVLRYGMARDLIVGLEAVLPDGTLWRSMKGLRKDNRGYDLKQLFIGSEGTLGIITGIEIKLFPRAERVETAYVGVASFDAAMALFGRARRAACDLVTAFEVIGSECLAMARLIDPEVVAPIDEAVPVHIVMEVSASASIDARALLEDLLADALDAGLAMDAVIAQSKAQAATFWAIREGIVEGQARRGYHVRTDISVRLSRVAAFVSEARAFVAADWPGWVPQAYGHAGDGNIHFNVLPPAALDRAAARAAGEALTEGLYRVVERFDGSISAEHGIGRVRRAAFWSGLSAVERRMMAAVKSAFDPAGLMNPGCLIPQAKDIS